MEWLGFLDYRYKQDALFTFVINLMRVLDNKYYTTQF